jgi:hypothetical protein
LAAITELAGALRCIKERLGEPEHEHQWAQAAFYEWIEPARWRKLAKLDREAFMRESEPLINHESGFVRIVREIITGG